MLAGAFVAPVVVVIAVVVVVLVLVGGGRCGGAGGPFATAGSGAGGSCAAAAAAAAAAAVAAVAAVAAAVARIGEAPCQFFAMPQAAVVPGTGSHASGAVPSVKKVWNRTYIRGALRENFMKLQLEPT